MSVCPTRRRLERELPFSGILSAHRSLEMHPMVVSPALTAAASAYLVTGPRLLMAKGALSEMAAQLALHCPESARLLIDRKSTR